MKGFFIFLAGLIGCFAAEAQGNFLQEATPLHRAEKALTDVIIHDIF